MTGHISCLLLLVSCLVDQVDLQVPTDPSAAAALIQQAIASAITQVQQESTLQSSRPAVGPLGGLRGFAGAPVPAGTAGATTGGVNNALWHHSRFSLGFNPTRVAAINQNAELARSAERNFNTLTGSAPGTLASSPALLGEFRTQIASVCNRAATPDPVCDPNARFRTADGTCNNLANPLWGSSFRAFKRYLPPVYGDGFDTPRTRRSNGELLPSARLISNVVHAQEGCCPVESPHTVMYMAFGQFRDHDYTSTPVVRGPDGEFLSCCPISPLLPQACFPVVVPPGDPKGTDCMTFVRSSAASDVCDPAPRQQTNQLTAYLDASSVYGSEQAEQNSLRTFVGGRLKVSPSGNLLPQDPRPNTCILEVPGHFCFDAGDKRHSEIATLTPSHIAFMRYHNNIAGVLQGINPFWNDERIFQETRKIVSAVLQHITYNEYVPIALGPWVTAYFGLRPSPFGFRNLYDTTRDATVANAFGAAVFRFGHSQIPARIRRLNSNFDEVANVALETQFDRPTFSHLPNGVEDLTRWETVDRQSLEDRRLEDSVREALFVDEAGDAFDLAALNIQRGRDHGLPPYNAWRQWCNLIPAFHFGGGFFGLTNHDADTRERLRMVYSHPEDIDLFTGGISETKLPGALVGPTFACIMGRQFFESQRGDRFYYENFDPRTGFTFNQLNEIKRTSLASVLCNTINLGSVQPDVFRPPSPQNPFFACNTYPQINLNHWRTNPGTDFGSMAPNSPILPILSSALRQRRLAAVASISNGSPKRAY